MESNIDTTEKEDCNTIYYNDTPDPINMLHVKHDKNTGIIMNVKTNKELTVNDVAIYYVISSGTVLDIVENFVNQHRSKSNV